MHAWRATPSRRDDARGTGNASRMTDQRTLTGTVALVTGASSGIGEATVAVLAAHGASVAAVARRKDRLDALAGRVGGSGGTALAVEADITREDDARRAVAETVERFGRLDILINNAGLMLLGADHRRRRERVDPHDRHQRARAHVLHQRRAAAPGEGLHERSEALRRPRQHQLGRRARRALGCRRVQRDEVRGQRVHRVAAAGSDASGSSGSRSSSRDWSTPSCAATTVPRCRSRSHAGSWSSSRCRRRTSRTRSRTS